MKRFLVLGLIIVFSGLFQACGTPQVLMGVKSTDRINPDDNGEALPVVVRVYQLRETGPFSRADFDTLWSDSERALGESLVGSQEFVVDPETDERIAIRRLKGADYLAVVAVFRDWHDTEWRSIEPLPTGLFSGFMSVTIYVDIDEGMVKATREASVL